MVMDLPIFDEAGIVQSTTLKVEIYADCFRDWNEYFDSEHGYVLRSLLHIPHRWRKLVIYGMNEDTKCLPMINTLAPCLPHL